MKVFNLTDVATPALAQRMLLNQTIAVGDKMLAPGASDDVDDETFIRVHPALQELVGVGAIAVGELPADYIVAKSKAVPKAAPSAPATNDEEPPAPVVSRTRGGR
jgi:hypothetical protein